MASEATEKAGAGRPSLYNPAYCEKVVEWGREGMSLVEIACEIGVVRQTLYDWEQAHPEFLDALTRARAECQAWWERQGRVNLATQGFNASLWAKNMGCRFKGDWTEKTQTELSGPDGGPIPTTITVVGVAP
jgi:hypothetical protein